MATLTRNDYQSILSYYDINYTNMSLKQLRESAEEILANKLCRCIKKVDPKVEKKSVPICRKSVLGRKGINIYGFHCKNKPRFTIGKNGQKLRKTLRSRKQLISKNYTRKNHR